MSNLMQTFEFKGVRDFSIGQILECGQCFRWEEIPGSQRNSYFVITGRAACLAEESAGDEEGKRNLKLQISDGDMEFWSDYFDFKTDYGLIKKALAMREPKIGAALEHGFGIRILHQDFWEVLISFIISQNNNIPRIKKCINAICEAYGESIGEFGGIERYSFPLPENLAGAFVDDLMKLRLGYRSEYIVRAAEKFIKDGIPQGDKDAQMTELLSYLGIGPKVANCISLFGLRNLDAFPIDTWVKKVMRDMYGFDLKDIKGMQRFAADRFGDMGGIAQQYLFYYYRDKNL